MSPILPDLPSLPLRGGREAALCLPNGRGGMGRKGSSVPEAWSRGCLTSQVMPQEWAGRWEPGAGRGVPSCCRTHHTLLRSDHRASLCQAVHVLMPSLVTAGSASSGQVYGGRRFPAMSRGPHPTSTLGSLLQPRLAGCESRMHPRWQPRFRSGRDLGQSIVPE